MAELSANPDDTSSRPRLSRETLERLQRLFPNGSADESVGWLLDRFENAAGLAANCGSTELFWRAARLEEVVSLLALTNIELADTYRRMISGEVGLLGEAAARLAEMAAASGTSTGQQEEA